MCGDRIEIELPDMKWMSFDGEVFDNESDAISHCAPVPVFFCPTCGDWKYTMDAAVECCAAKL